MGRYRTRLKRDIAGWTASGLIDGATAARLLAEVETRPRRSIHLGSILAMLAALLFAMAAVVFVAADWDAIPRALRAACLGVLVAAFLAVGETFRRRGREGAGEAAFVAAAGMWGAFIILVAQMLDLPRNGQAMLLFWCVGTGLAGFAFRSRALTVCAAALGAAWLAYTGLPFGSGAHLRRAYPVLAAALWLVSLHARARAARDILMLSLTLYLVLLIHDLGWPVLGGLLLAGGAGALFVLAARRQEEAERITQLEGRAPLHLLVAGLAGLAVVQGAEIDAPGFALAAAAMLIAIASALLVGGLSGAGVRRLLYAAFASEVCVIYGVTVGTTLDTATFFLAAAALLGLLAFIVARVERRLKRVPAIPQG